MTENKRRLWNLNHTQATLLYMILVISSFLFGLRLYALIAHDENIRHTLFFGSKMLGVILIILMILFHRHTPVKLNWNGLRGTKEELIPSLKIGGLMALAVIAVLIGYRIYLNKTVPGATEVPWFGLYLNVNTRWFYPINIPFQELFIKSFVQENITKVFDQKHRHLPIIVTSLFFFIIHVQYPLYYMLGAALLCLSTGYLYRKYPTIWGPVLVHMAIGFLPRCFGIFQIIE
ncbi:MAG: CPBP family intramembrane metalloprotease [Solobacterium sp.]|nr:CPBP family intramembrane metalloprotease [Solobacterium sp.]